MDLEQSQACDGQFEEEYQPLKAVGKGAFGFVWKAVRRSDGEEVRTFYSMQKHIPFPLYTICSDFYVQPQFQRSCDTL